MKSYITVLTAMMAVSLTAFANDDVPRPRVTTDGASFEAPASWVSLKASRSKTKAWFVPRDSDLKAPPAMIMVDIGKPTDSDLRKTAEGMAKLWGGSVLEETTELDGEVALRVRVTKPGSGLRPIEGVATMRNGRLYLVMGGSKDGRDMRNEVESVRRSWRWVDE